MLLIVLGGVCAAQGSVKGLAFQGRVGGNVQLLRALPSGPFTGGVKQCFPDAVSAQILRYMKRGQIKISVPAAKQAVFYRDETLQCTGEKGSADEPAAADRMFPS